MKICLPETSEFADSHLLGLLFLFRYRENCHLLCHPEKRRVCSSLRRSYTRSYSAVKAIKNIIIVIIIRLESVFRWVWLGHRDQQHYVCCENSLSFSTAPRPSRFRRTMVRSRRSSCNGYGRNETNACGIKNIAITPSPVTSYYVTLRGNCRLRRP